MKNFITGIVCFLLLITVCASLVSCSQNDISSSMKFEKKYVALGDNSSHSYIFYADGTGIYEVHDVYVYEEFSDYNYTLSGQVEFVWREASDGAVYLFETDVKYNSDHTEGKTLSVTHRPIYFSEDFLVYRNGENVATRFIIEGSELDKILEN